MATKWQEVRVFISSTFQDMHAERDHLVKRVFPQLRERLLAYRIHLVDIDLRWGITEEEAENDRVLDLCLQQIDGCRPFFVGILGERYGWVPKKMPVMERPEYGWVQSMTGKSATELEILHGVLRNPEMIGHAFFYFRDPAFGAELSEDLRAKFIDEGTNAEKLAALKEEIRGSGFPVMESYSTRWDADEKHLTDLDAFGEQILEDLWSGIQSEHKLPDEPPTYEDDPLAEERDYHDRFIESRTQIYIGRESVQVDLIRFADGNSTVPCLVTGPSGSGKSATLAKFVRNYGDQHPDTFLLAHFVGASPRSTGLRDMLTRICQELRDAFDITETVKRPFEEQETVPAQIPLELNGLVATFAKFLRETPTDHCILLVFDGLNQLDETDNAQLLLWLPQEFPTHVKVVVSCIADPGREEPVLNAFANRNCERQEVTALTPKERFDIATKVPSVSAKKLDPKQMERLLSNPATENPLYLLVALEELRGFGSFEALNERIDEFPRGYDPVTALFIQVIDRLEEDFDTTNVRDLLSLLASARRGLSQAELLELIEGHDDFAASTSDLFPILRQIRTYLQHRGDLLDFFHRNFYKATRSKYLTQENETSADLELSGHSIPPLKGDQGGCSPLAQQEAHNRLADYFAAQPNYLDAPQDPSPAKRLPNTRRCDELPWQLAQAQRTTDLETLLITYDFLQAKITTFGPQPLIEDYAFLNPDNNAPLGLIQGAIRLSSNVIRKDPDLLASQLHGRMLSFGKTEIANLLNRAAETQTGPWLRPVHQTLAAPGGPLIRTIEIPGLEIYAFTITPAGLVLTCSEDALRLWDLDTGECVRIFFETPGSAGDTLTMTPSGQVLFARAREGMLKLLNADTGECLVVIKCQNIRTSSVAFTPTNNVVIADDQALKLFSLDTGECIRTFKCDGGRIESVRMTPSGNLLTTSADGAIKLYELDSGKCRWAVANHFSPVSSFSLVSSSLLSLDSVAITTLVDTDGKTVSVLDMETGSCLHQFELNDEIETGSCLRQLEPAGEWGGSTESIMANQTFFALECDTKNTFALIDIYTGMCLRTFHGFGGVVINVMMTSDGHLLSIFNDSTFRLWDLDTGECLRVFRGHFGLSVRVAMMPNGDVISADSSTLKLWNLHTREKEGRFDGHSGAVYALASTPDGDIISGGTDHNLKLWDSSTGECFRTLEGHSGLVKAISVTTDGRGLSASHDKTLKHWDLDTGECLHTLEGHDDWVTDVTMTPNGCALSASWDNTLKLWNVDTGECLRTFKGSAHTIHRVVMSPSGNALSTSNCDAQVWDITSGENIKTIYGPKGAVATFMPNGDILSTFLNDLVLWDLETEQVMRSFEGHTSKIFAAVVTATGCCISASENGVIKYWDINTGRCLMTYIHECGLLCLIVSADEQIIITGDTFGAIHWLRLENFDD